MEFDEWTGSQGRAPRSSLRSAWIRSPAERRLFRLGVLVGVLSLAWALWPMHQRISPGNTPVRCGSVLFPDSSGWSTCESAHQRISGPRPFIAAGLAASVTLLGGAVIHHRYRWVIAVSAAAVVATAFVAFTVRQLDAAYRHF